MDPSATSKRRVINGDVLLMTETHQVLSVSYNFIQVKALSLMSNEILNA